MLQQALADHDHDAQLEGWVQKIVNPGDNDNEHFEWKRIGSKWKCSIEEEWSDEGVRLPSPTIVGDYEFYDHDYLSFKATLKDDFGNLVIERFRSLPAAREWCEGQMNSQRGIQWTDYTTK